MRRRARTAPTSRSATASRSHGCCLTVVERDGARLEFDVSARNARAAPTGFDVGRERQPREIAAARRSPRRPPGERARRRRRHRARFGRWLRRQRQLALAIEAPAALARYIARKGSIAIDGVSLTVNASTARLRGEPDPAYARRDDARATCVRGARVNLEVDLMARYVAGLDPGASPGRRRLSFNTVSDPVYAAGSVARGRREVETVELEEAPLDVGRRRPRSAPASVRGIDRDERREQDRIDPLADADRQLRLQAAQAAVRAVPRTSCRPRARPAGHPACRHPPSAMDARHAPAPSTPRRGPRRRGRLRREERTCFELGGSIVTARWQRHRSRPGRRREPRRGPATIPSNDPDTGGPMDLTTLERLPLWIGGARTSPHDDPLRRSDEPGDRRGDPPRAVRQRRRRRRRGAAPRRGVSGVARRRRRCGARAC